MGAVTDSSQPLTGQILEISKTKPQAANDINYLGPCYASAIES
jgi:hypothetical protein